MSHTNSTPNYNLPQFVGTDKPTWLNDVNGAMSAIDTQMKANADGVTTADTKATTANNAIGTLTSLETTAKTDLVSAVNEVNATARTAQSTANTAIGSANAVASDLNAFEQKFNLINITNGNLNNTSVTGNVFNNLKLAQNGDGSIFKMYGSFQINPNSTATRTAVAGLTGQYGVDTGLVLTTAPTTAYVVQGAGIHSENSESNSAQVLPEDFAVGTNGHIYISLNTENSNARPSLSGRTMRNMYIPAIYFNASFGDEPSPDN